MANGDDDNVEVLFELFFSHGFVAFLLPLPTYQVDQCNVRN